MKRYGLLLVFVLILSACPTPFARADWWDCNWLYSIRLTFNNTASSENLVNFPVLVNLTSSSIGWANVQSDGDDLRFLDSDNSTELDYEIEYWDYAGEEASIWVEVPQIDAGSTTDHIFLYYGNVGASSGEDVEGTWNQDYVMVQHLQEQNGSIYDSTANDNDGSASPTTFGQDKWVSGLRGNALDFDGSNDYENVPDDATLDITSEITVEAWVNIGTMSGGLGLRYIIGKGYHWENEPYTLYVTTTPAWGWKVSNGTHTDDFSTTASGGWHHLIGTFNSSYSALYVDNVEVDGGVPTISSLESNNHPLGIGGNYNAERWLNGTIDDARIYNRVINSTERSYSYNSGAGADPMNTTGLVGWWKLDESGLTENATDSSGEGNHGTLYGYPPDYTASGQIDGATDFDGNEDGITISDSSSLGIGNAGDEYTIELHVKLKETRNYLGRVISKESPTPYPFTFRISANTGDLYLAIYDGANNPSISKTLVLDEWTYIAGVVKRGDSINVYKNEESPATTPDTTSGDINNTALLLIGGQSTRYSCVDIDECRISNVSRTADWIEAQYLSMTDQFITFSGISGMYIELYITVEDAADSQPIEDACATLFFEGDLNFTEFTDSDGEIPRKVVDEGNYTLIVTADTYQTYSYILLINETTYWVPQLDTLEEGITIPLAFMTFMFAGLGVMYFSIKEKTPEQRTLGFIFCIILWIATWGIWVFDNSTSNYIVLGWVFMAPIGLCMIYLTEGAIDYLDKVESEL